MQPARVAVAPGAPAFLVTRPALGRHLIARPELLLRISREVLTHPVCLVVAPAGYGKTMALSAWAEQCGRPVAWLSLTPADRHPEHLAHGLATALAQQTPGSNGTDSPQGQVLVIDDVHHADGESAQGVLTGFLEHPPPGQRVVIAGRSVPRLGLSRLQARGELGTIPASELSFTAAEVELAARAVGRPLEGDAVEELRAETGGWPVAVRLALIANSARGARPALDDTGIPQLPEYLIENVLDGLPPELRDFVLRTSTCDWLTSAVASALSASPQGSELLERAVAAGLPLERRGTFGGEPVYRWHPLMAQAGRAILLRRDPELARDLHRRAARALAGLHTFEAATHALRGRDPELAATLMRSQWLAAVLRGDSELIEELCGLLPAPWSEDPEILAIRAASLRNSGDAEAAGRMERRALAASARLDAQRRGSFDLTLLLARLFVIDDAVGLEAASERAQQVLADLVGPDGATRACALLLIGWTELRLRHVRVALAVLREAAQRCQAEGLDDLAERARANFGFGLAFAGDFTGAKALVASSKPEARTAGWRRGDGAIEWFTLGWIRYWSGDADGAIDALWRVVDQGGGLISYGQLARCWIVDAAVDAGNPETISRIEPLLAEVPDQTIQGLPWRLYKWVARAGVALTRGDTAAAAALLDEVRAQEPSTPAANAQMADLYWRCGRVESARAQAALVLGDLPGYLRIGGLVITALCVQREGDDALAHRLIEESLALGAAQGLWRPFNRPDAELTGLLTEHAARGTAHEIFLAEALARQRRVSNAGPGRTLTDRERAIAGHLQTTMSAAEIAAALHISQNTLKTHLKSVYRKLGVANRRQAVRVLRSLGSSSA